MSSRRGSRRWEGGASNVTTPTDWTLALAVGLAAVSGLASLLAGRAEMWPIFAAHGAAGLWLGLLLWGKLRRVLPRRLAGSGASGG